MNEHSWRKVDGINRWDAFTATPYICFLGKTIGQTTVFDVQTVEVAIYSARFSTPVAYHYAGAEKDADIAEYCRGLTFTGRYQPYITALFARHAAGCRIHT